MHVRVVGLACVCWLISIATAGTLGTAAPVRPHAESVAKTSSTRSLYVLHCSGCHGMDGSGSETGRVPDMRYLARFLNNAEGRAFLIKVPGVMGSGLNDADVARVTNWVVENLALDVSASGFQRYTEQEVNAYRREPLTDVMRTRADLFTKFQSR